MKDKNIKVWEVEIEMTVNGFEHIWNKYVSGNNENSAKDNALTACCHCDPDDIYWHSHDSAECLESDTVYTILSIREATWMNN